jgi:beta-lactamase regulating signal transducer with metallopeptidase domain
MQIITGFNWLSQMLLSLSPVLLMVAIKTTLILLAILVVLKITPRLPAATRYRIIVIAIAGALALPVFSLLLPTWNVIPAWTGRPSLPARAANPVPESLSPAAVTSLDAPVAQEIIREPTTVADAPVRAIAPSAASETDAFNFNWLDLVALLTGIWLLGIVIGTVRLYRAITATRRLVAQAIPITDPQWLSLMIDCCQELGSVRPVALLFHGNHTMPTTWGLSNPVIVLPREADNWTADHKRLVLLHELAHIHRRDNGLHLLSLLSCTIHWYNPLVWKAFRNLKAERERACDDMVLQTGAEAQSYAEMLLQSVAKFRPATAVAPAMARSTELESRLLAIIDTGRNRAYLKGKIMTSILLALAVLAPIAAADFVEPRIAVSDATPSISTKAPAAGPRMTNRIERSFKVKYGDKLKLDVGGGPVKINTSTAKKVEILIEARGGEIAESDFEFNQEQGVVSVLMKDWDDRDHRWRARISYTIKVPEEFDLDVYASGGSSEIDDIKGEVIVHNSGGGLTLGRIDGNVDARTSGGSLTAEDITGNGELRSSGGRLRFGDVGGSITARASGGSLAMGNAGGPANLRASGGSVEAGNINGSAVADASGGSVTTLDVNGDADFEASGGSVTAGAVSGKVSARASGGSIIIDEVGGSLNASASGGRIEAYITRQPDGTSNLSTSGGGVILYVKDNIKFSLQMNVTNPDIVSTDFATKKPLADDAIYFSGDINGGGPDMRIRTRGNRYNEANIFVLKASGK